MSTEETSRTPTDVKEKTTTTTRPSRDQAEISFVAHFGNLSLETSSERLKEIVVGKTGVEPKQISMPKTETGDNRGFAFAYFSTSDERAQIIDKLNGADLDGRTLAVSETRPRSRGGRGGRGGRGSRGARGGRGGRGRGRGTSAGPLGTDVRSDETTKEPEPIIKYLDEKTGKEVEVRALIVEKISMSTTEQGFLQLLGSQNYQIFKCDFGEAFNRRTGEKSHRAFLLVPHESSDDLLAYLNKKIIMDGVIITARGLHSAGRAAQRLLGQNESETAQLETK